MHLCRGNGLLTGTDPEEQQRQLKKQKNRAAAQRSRQKHTDKADALHQQHESLEKDNLALRKEIQALQAELAWWSQTLHVHERLCPMDCASCSAPGLPGCWDQAEGLLGPGPQGQHGCQEQLELFQTLDSCSPAQPLSPGPQPHDSPSLLQSPLPSLSLGPTVVAEPPVQLSPSPLLFASHTGSSLQGSSSKLNALQPSLTAQTAPPQPLELEHPTRGKLKSSPNNPSSDLGLACLQSREHKPALSAAAWQGLGVDPSPHPLLAFPLLASLKSTSNLVSGAALAPSSGSGSNLSTRASPPSLLGAALRG
ncbi:PREDICTED: basic leucine zipper transcriptional factor ATF-like 2 isoform X1 [Cercocebus atys]|uniref:basic leucine zipper transcriptional factor ATF-like 2 isoform X1 n=1 Tax=Cercocebus atys TaxID=9531 RepID=UPI0005F36C5F|nr:PREDICTED: basic leucine zipper transcriptional factor ATF-like 2 isoform X1 [Cercocebus atys]